MGAAVDTRLAEEHSLAAQVAELRFSLARYERSGMQLEPEGVATVCAILASIETQADRMESMLRRLRGGMLQ